MGNEASLEGGGDDGQLPPAAAAAAAGAPPPPAASKPPSAPGGGGQLPGSAPGPGPRSERRERRVRGQVGFGAGVRAEPGAVALGAGVRVQQAGAGFWGAGRSCRCAGCVRANAGRRGQGGSARAANCGGPRCGSLGCGQTREVDGGTQGMSLLGVQSQGREQLRNINGCWGKAGVWFRVRWGEHRKGGVAWWVRVQQ